METENKTVYPDLLVWYTSGKVVRKGEDLKTDEKDPITFHVLTWIRFWRNNKEYQSPMRMSVDFGVTVDKKLVKQYEEQFHKRCLDFIRFGKATGDFIEPIKFDDKHIVDIYAGEIPDLNEKEDE